MLNRKVEVINKDAAKFLEEDSRLYGVIIIDLPDPDSIDLMHVYSINFYRMLHRHLIKGGVFVTQATSPYFSGKAFLCIMKTIREGGFSILPYHNQIPTMGEWGWVIGARRDDITEKGLKKLIVAKDFTSIETRFVNNDAVISMIYFGKGILAAESMDVIDVNTELNPVLHRYYLSGSWGMY
jgi:spermidine synthase